MTVNVLPSKKPKKNHRGHVGYLYLLPWIIGFLLFQLYPLMLSLFYSFTDYGAGDSFSLVGLANYVRMFTVDRDFLNSLGVTFRYVFLSVPMKLGFALIIAMILNIKIGGMNFFRTAYYLPSILGGSVAVAILWRNLFAIDGVINTLIGFVGLPPVRWLSSPDVALFTISLLSVWQFGSSMVFFLAALKQIPSELYEASRVDGAGPWMRFSRITIPMITPTIFFNLIMQMINAFQEFTAPFVITGGGPLNSTHMYGMLLYTNAFKFFKMGYASALSWILFAIILTFTAMIFKSSDYWAFYSDNK